MSWRFRRSYRFGPLRLNLSRRGIGYSFGGFGFRLGRRARGTPFYSMSVPGTGWSYVEEGSSRPRVRQRPPSILWRILRITLWSFGFLVLLGMCSRKP